MYRIIFALFLAGCASNTVVPENQDKASLEKKVEVVQNEKKEVKIVYKSYDECRKLDNAKSYKKSFSCYTDISKNEDVKGYIGLAKAYHYGNGVKKDLERAVLNYEKAAELGDDQSALMLGSMYESGLLEGGINDEKAFYWYEKSGLNGNAKAAFALSSLYVKGKGVQKDSAKSIYWLEVAAERGVPLAQYLIGESYYKRYLLTKNNEFLLKSKDLLEKSSKQGDNRANELLKVVDDLLK
ncbi:MAG: putative beta-lactamase HcpD precursor [Alphaproteobacteria bacterium ADurb.Bin438]|nr:MAG: putative beta-lactamase HcpD precursor [Alphaproteobacteria bacterium ADurb.Bin438]